MISHGGGSIIDKGSGGGSPQTPWTSAINGGGFSLTNVNNISSSSLDAGTVDATSITAGTVSASGFVTDAKSNTFCRVTFGEGNGGEGNYTVGSFNIINFGDLAFYTKIDPGINYVEGPDGDGNVDYYLVPASGYYLVVLSLRTTDSSPEQDIGIGVNVDILLGGSNVGYDSPSFHWGRVQATTGGDASGRETHQDTQIVHFNAGDHVIAFAYSDTSALGVSDGNMSIVLLFPD